MRRYLLILVLVTFFCFRGFLYAQDMGGRALLTFQETQSEQTTTIDFSQSYELRFQKRVTPTIQYRLFIQWQDDFGKTKEEDHTDKVRTQLFKPSFDLLYNFSPFELRAGLELTRTKTKPDPGVDHLLEQKRFFSRFSWKPEGLPNFDIQLDRKMDEDKKSLLDIVDTSLNTTAEYSYKAFKFLNNFRFDQFDDLKIDYTKKEYDNLARVDYQDNFLENRLNITTNYLIDYRRRYENVSGDAPISIPMQHTARKGLYSNDDTPLDNTDHLMVDTPSLIDGNLNLSTGINIGTPGGLSFQNIGIDLGRSLAADQIQICVRNASGGLVPFGGPITWNVYTSSDGIHWTLAVAAATTIFNATQSRYEITFSSITAQFFKVVNFGANTVGAFVTEIQIFGQNSFVPGEKRTTTTLIQTGNLTTMVKPLEKVTLTYDGFFNTLKEGTETEPTFTSTEWTQGITALLEPLRFFSMTLRYQKRKLTQSEGQDQGSDFYSGVLNFLFLKDLNTSLSISEKNEKIDGEKSNSNTTLLLHNAAKLYKNWDVNLDLGYSREKNFTEDQLTDRYTITGTSFAQLRQNLSWSLNATAQWSSVTNLTEEKNQDTRVTTEFFYRPSHQINLATRWGYVKGRDVSGLTHRYKLEWFPFPDGAIQFTGTYELDRDPTSKQSQDRYNGILRWNINRYAYLELNYTRAVQKSTEETTRTQTFFTTFNLTF